MWILIHWIVLDGVEMRDHRRVVALETAASDRALETPLSLNFTHLIHCILCKRLRVGDGGADGGAASGAGAYCPPSAASELGSHEHRRVIALEALGCLRGLGLVCLFFPPSLPGLAVDRDGNRLGVGAHVGLWIKINAGIPISDPVARLYCSVTTNSYASVSTAKGECIDSYRSYQP